MPTDDAIQRVTVGHMVEGGHALARDAEGRVMFVAGAITGETVDVLVTESRRDFRWAVVTAVIDAAPTRVTPPCPAWHRGCGGCDWQYIAPDAQLALKADIVRDALRRIGRLGDAVVREAGSVRPWGYRTTLRVATDHTGTVGLRAHRSHDVIALDGCPVAAGGIDRALAYGEVDGHRAAGHDVQLRVGTSGERVSIHTIAAPPRHRGRPVRGERQRSHSPTVATSPSVVINVVADRQFRVSATSFFQSSPEAAELLVDAVARAAGDVDVATSTVIDAYGGVGLFAATVAHGARRVVLIESSTSSCADARHNLGLDGRRRDRHGADIVVHESTVEAWTPETAELVIADPARAGLGREAASRLAATGAPRIVLVSCDAAALGRDARLLGELGYRHCGTDVVDVFPNTSHVEAVTRFDRAEA